MKSIQRTFIPGSQWLYFKLYTGQKTADVLLSELLPVIHRLKKKEYIDKWFFIRYSDPDFHIRIRFRLTHAQHMGEVMNLLYKKLSAFQRNSLLWKVQLDTYNRELERYGREFMEDSESVFHFDSECITSLLKKLSETGNEHYRWMISLRLIDALLEDLSLDLSAKWQMMDKLSKSFKTEFGFNEYNAKQFNSKFREHKKTVESVLRDTLTDEAFLPLYIPIRERSQKLAPVISQIQIRKKAHRDFFTDSLVPSYIHMTLNRLFRSKNRKHELIIYDFMKRYYASVIARNQVSAVR